MAINLQTILVNLIRISIGKSDMKTTISARGAVKVCENVKEIL